MYNTAQLTSSLGSSGGKVGTVANIAGLAAAPFTFGLSAVVGFITSIFTHHQQAVKNEAAALNAAVPSVRDAWSQIFSGLNAGTISRENAAAGIDETLKQYESVVYEQAKVKRKAGNGPDTVESTWLKPWADKLKAIISGGGGTFTSDKIGPHAGFSGLEQFSLSYNGGSAVNPFAWGKSELQNIEAALTGKSGSSLGVLVVVAGVLLLLWWIARR